MHNTPSFGGYNCILIDPPWPQRMSNPYKNSKQKRPPKLPYKTMALEEIADLPVGTLGGDGSHLWLWTTNQFLRDGFDLMECWGFKYLAPVHWIKPSGLGNWFVTRTQTLLFGYKSPCKFGPGRYSPNIIEAVPPRHSQKPEVSFELIESISSGPRIELFARAKREGWDSWGDEC